MKKIALNLTGYIIACAVASAISVVILLQFNGVSGLVLGAFSCILLETGVATSALSKDDNEDINTVLWLGCSFHLIAFLTTFILTSSLGWWGKPYEWVAERGHGVFTDEVSPASQWYILSVLAAIRLLILQPIYIFFAKRKSRHEM